jgi:drug/metabolite transporter (DMT)-like permease
MALKTLRIEHLAMIAVALSGLAWGLFWIPLRALDHAGIAGVWAVVLFYVLPALLLVPIMFLRWSQIVQGGWSLHLAGMLAGVALVSYAGALIFTDVVRALLFYYLTPLWSTLLARIVIGERIAGARWGTVSLGFVGLLVLLRVDTGFSGSLNVGDWMGLAGGFLWAMAAVGMKSNESGNGIDFTLSYFIWGSVAALALTLLPFEGAKTIPDWSTFRDVLPWIVPVALVLVIPPAFAIMWGATILSPGLLAILFMTEISAGTITVAIWANEPFGLRELSGIVLITVAGIFEPVLQTLRRGPP